ncbi:MAG: isoprenyl transferase [Firmicutes bacterium]|nr:isoprenyl transferase [Bacillota bacterium]MBQ2041653.1 isoprenyl transferase [Bacillota bacterium]MBQ5415013.1 isoprenyl transferase [Bacillota bacterium]MBQ6670657.1 isoprenyl transferase [Bacillota bacterium]
MDMTRIPRHVAIIMDGNGRWAKERGQIRLQGHLAGMEALCGIVRHSSDIGVEYLTVYAFSTENWKRPADEVSGIFKLLIKFVKRELDELNRNNVRIDILGDWSIIPEDSADSIRLALATTEKNDGLKLNIALNYGGRAEITRAVNMLIDSGKKNVTEEDISACLYTAGMPDPDVIIRTSGESRLSNFLIWQSAYSEIVLTPVYWPDFTPSEYERCLAEYQSRDRRFGGHK